MDNTNYRPLLPATRPRPPPSRPLPKKTRIPVACDVCRHKRTRCDGNRPVCTACTERSTDCVYTSQEDKSMRLVALRRENTALRAQVAEFHDIMKLLKNMPPDAVQHSLHHLTTSADPAGTLRILRGGPTRIRIPDQTRAMSLFPGAPPHSDVQMIVRHPVAYPVVDSSSRAKSLYMHVSSFSSPPTTPILHNQSIGVSGKGPPIEDLVHPEGVDNFSDFPSSYFDSRLAELNIGFWTSVPLTNAYAAKVISLYLDVQHSFWGSLDAWLFVRDLVGFRFDFCSSFMVNSLLAAALQTHSLGDPQASSYSFACEKEAERLFLAETTLDSLPALAGMALLHASLASHGEGERGTSYLAAASRAAENMKLFGVSDALLSLFESGMDPLGTLAGTGTAAWGLFSAIDYQSRFYSLVSRVRFPPALPIPGDPSTGWMTMLGAEAEKKPIYGRAGISYISGGVGFLSLLGHYQ